jgi:hypothetical protein
LLGINVRWAAEKMGPQFVTVALLRSDQDWMAPHLRERGLVARISSPLPTKETD